MCVCVLCVHQLYPSLCELAHVLSVDGPVKQRLDTLAGELAKAADKELQVGWGWVWTVALVVIAETFLRWCIGILNSSGALY